MKPYNEDGSIAQSDVFTFPSPIATLLKESKTSTNRTLGSMNLNYEIIEDLNANFKVGMDRRTGRADLFTPGIANSAGSGVAT